MNELGWLRAVGSVGSESSSGPDNWDGGIGWGGRLAGWLWLLDGARAVSDGDGLLGSRSVCLGTLGEGGGLWAVGGVGCDDLSGVGSLVVPSAVKGSSSGDESEDGEEALNGLHFDS